MESEQISLIDLTMDSINCTNSSEIIKANQNELFIPLYIYIIVSIVNAAIFIFGTFGNILVIISVVKVRGMLTPTNVFLLNLSLADILVLMICQPSGLLEFFGKDRWFLGPAMCKLVPMIENGVLHVSILTMIAVTLERYNALCHPFKGRLSYTISSTVKTIVIIWITGSLFAMPFFIMTEHEDAKFYDGKAIKVCRTKVNEPWRYLYTIIIVTVFFVVPFIVLLGIYSKIIKQLTSDKLKSLTQNDRTAVHTFRARKQVVKMLVLIIVLFFISLFPIRAVTIWLIFTPSEHVANIGLEAFLNMMAWSRILMYINSAGNPIIYSVTSTKFKMAFLKVLGRKTNKQNPSKKNQNPPLRQAYAQQPNENGDNRDGSPNKEERSYLVIKLVLFPECGK